MSIKQNHEILAGDIRAALRRNLVQTFIAPQTSGGVTVESNDDGFWILNGSSSVEREISVSIYLNTGRYRITGCPNRDDTELRLHKSDWSWSVYSRGGSGTTFTITEDIKGWFLLGIYAQAGVTYTNVVFKPMITSDLETNYDDFVLYDNPPVTPISDFPSGIPTASDKVLFEQNGEEKSASISDVGKVIGINTDLLWTNANPTSEFPGQFISLDLSKYKYILINFYFDMNNTRRTHLCLLDKVDKPVSVSNVYDQFGIARQITGVRDNGVSIGSGVITSYPVGGAEYTIHNAQMIPHQIYGVK